MFLFQDTFSRTCLLFTLHFAIEYNLLPNSVYRECISNLMRIKVIGDTGSFSTIYMLLLNFHLGWLNYFLFLLRTWPKQKLPQADTSKYLIILKQINDKQSKQKQLIYDKAATVICCPFQMCEYHYCVLLNLVIKFTLPKSKSTT